MIPYYIVVFVFRGFTQDKFVLAEQRIDVKPQYWTKWRPQSWQIPSNNHCIYLTLETFLFSEIEGNLKKCLQKVFRGLETSPVFFVLDLMEINLKTIKNIYSLTYHFRALFCHIYMFSRVSILRNKTPYLNSEINYGYDKKNVFFLKAHLNSWGWKRNYTSSMLIIGKCIGPYIPYI